MIYKDNFKRKDEKNKKAFFINKQVIKTLYKNFKILIINCIYKINKYKMLLLTIIEYMIINFTFIVNFTFLIKEIANYYDWILNYLKTLYVDLKFINFCVIVINQNLILIIIINVQYFYREFEKWRFIRRSYKDILSWLKTDSTVFKMI